MSKDNAPTAYNHGPGSFAHNNAHLLPGEPLKHGTGASLSRESFDNARDSYIVKQKQDMQTRQAMSRENFMVKRSTPQHIMRPPMQMAMAADRAAFTQRWHEEQLHARKLQQSFSMKEDFMGQRTSHSRGKHRTHNR